MNDIYGRTQSESTKLFLKEIVEVCKKHEKSIAHEDGHGAFVIEPLSFDPECAWILAATENDKESRGGFTHHNKSLKGD